MSVNFTMREPKLRGFEPSPPFGLYDRGAAPHEVLRLLLGSVNVYDKIKNLSIKIDINELRKGGNRTANPKTIVRFIFDDAISVEEYARFVKSVDGKNGDFFRTLQRELTLCLVAKKSNRFTESFLYLYRILEYISIAFPMLYALTQPSFDKSHQFLKSILPDEKAGHLKVLETTIPLISKNGGFDALKFNFSAEGININDADALRTELEHKIANNVKGFEFEDLSVGNVLFSVPFNRVPTLLVNTRNRIFHYRIGEGNVDLGSINGSEPICRVILSEALYWFSLLYTEILRVLAQQRV